MPTPVHSHILPRYFIDCSWESDLQEKESNNYLYFGNILLFSDVEQI